MEENIPQFCNIVFMREWHAKVVLLEVKTRSVSPQLKYGGTFF